jgi:hypothetical protein
MIERLSNNVNLLPRRKCPLLGRKRKPLSGQEGREAECQPFAGVARNRNVNQTAVNAVLANGSILPFRCTDTPGHAVVLIRTGPLSRPDKTNKSRRIQMPLDVMSFAYASAPRVPMSFNSGETRSKQSGHGQ